MCGYWLVVSIADLGLPRPPSLDLQHQTPTQECSDHDQYPENDHVLKRGFKCDSLDDVSSDKEVESDEQTSSHVTLEGKERLGSAGTQSYGQPAEHGQDHRRRNHNDRQYLD